MTWLRDFVKSFEETEPPERYFYWAGLAALSAIIGNKIYLDRFTYRLYPNLFIFLVGKSGLRKGVPVDKAKQIVSTVNNTRIYSGRLSVEARRTGQREGSSECRVPDGRDRPAVGLIPGHAALSRVHDEILSGRRSIRKRPAGGVQYVERAR